MAGQRIRGLGPVGFPDFGVGDLTGGPLTHEAGPGGKALASIAPSRIEFVDELPSDPGGIDRSDARIDIGEGLHHE